PVTHRRPGTHAIAGRGTCSYLSGAKTRGIGTMKSRNFFSELKRRNVYKVAVAYAVVGWLVMQVASTVVPALHLPDAITTAVVMLTLLGFPIALVLAWAFELTSEGIKRTEDVDRSTRDVSTNRIWVYV